MQCIPKPVWAVGFAHEQTLHVVALAVFSYVDFFKVAVAQINSLTYLICQKNVNGYDSLKSMCSSFQYICLC
ncbi:MAG: hypothetical protein LBH59_08595 [Planctomycetaceae bacterium]|nr:hypothetical protein [Planctomycetaceae bacterium]